MGSLEKTIPDSPRNGSSATTKSPKSQKKTLEWVKRPYDELLLEFTGPRKPVLLTTHMTTHRNTCFVEILITKHDFGTNFVFF